MDPTACSPLEVHEHRQPLVGVVPADSGCIQQRRRCGKVGILKRPDMRRKEVFGFNRTLFAQQRTGTKKMQLARGFVRVEDTFSRRVYRSKVAAPICVARMRDCREGSAAAAVVTPKVIHTYRRSFRTPRRGT